MPDTNTKIRVAVIDDQHLFRQSLSMLIQSVNEFELVAGAGNGKEFLDMLPGIEPAVDVALVDLDMPVMNGVELNRILHQRGSKIRVIILSVHDEERIVAQMIEAGASAYLAKNCDKDELILAIQTVHRAGYYMNAAALKALQNSGRKEAEQDSGDNGNFKLTKREKQILELICQEFTNAEIGKKLYISPRTVEGHRNNLLEKTGSHTTAGLAIYAIKNQIFKV